VRPGVGDTRERSIGHFAADAENRLSCCKTRTLLAASRAMVSYNQTCCATHYTIGSVHGAAPARFGRARRGKFTRSARTQQALAEARQLSVNASAAGGAEVASVVKASRSHPVFPNHDPPCAIPRQGDTPSERISRRSPRPTISQTEPPPRGNRRLRPPRSSDANCERPIGKAGSR
jgi:hypothetical protein